VDKTIKLWDLKTCKERATLKGHTAGVQSVAYSPDGKTLASGGEDDTIKLWDINTGKEQDTLKGHTAG
jgi:WD40 repeat protein